MRSSLLLLPLLLIACVIQGNQPAHDAPGEARSATGMVSAATPEATEAGLRVLRNGGNAVDAAVAVGFALAVTYPQAGNLGGGGFMVIRMSDGRTTTIDFRERAPAAATRDMFLDSSGNFLPERAQLGALAAGVPGSPAACFLRWNATAASHFLRSFSQPLPLLIPGSRFIHGCMMTLLKSGIRSCNSPQPAPSFCPGIPRWRRG